MAKRLRSFLIEYCYLLLHVRQLQPLHVAEVLTMRQVFVLWIHADSTLVESCLLRSKRALEDEVIAIAANQLQRFDREDALLTFLIGEDIYLLQGNSIVQSLFVDNITEGVLLTSLNA